MLNITREGYKVYKGGLIIMLDKMDLTTMDYIRFIAPEIGLFAVGIIVDLILIAAWCVFLDKFYTKKNSKLTYKID